MLHNLKYSVTFPSTGRSFNGDIQFKGGLTAIIGPNEAGKSLVLEFIRYALFGKAALRGKAEDYKTLHVELSFSARGKAYKVVRNRRNETLYEGNTEIATGAAVLNVKIPEILGFGLKVFDAACAANQGQIEALGSMTPTERRRMVDSVIGLNVIEELQKWVNDEANAERRNYEAVFSILVAPKQPERPADYASSLELDAEFRRLLDLQRKKADIEARLNTPPAKPGEAPKAPDIQEPLEELEAQQVEYVRLTSLLAQRKAAHDAIPDPEYTAEELDAVERQWTAYDAYKQREEEIRTLGPKPEISAEEARAGLAQWDAYHAWKTKQDLLARGFHECPACHHQWPIADLGPYADAVETPKPEKDRRWYELQLTACERWTNAPEPLPEVALPKLSRAEVNFHRGLIEKAGLKKQLAEEIKAIRIPADRSQDIALLKAYEREVAHYQQLAGIYQQWEEWAAQARVALQELGDVDRQLVDINRRLTEARAYEQALSAYEAQKVRYEQNKARAEEYRAKAEQLKAAAEALKILRSKIKQHLVPSLNAVASRLLNRMTGGERNVISIDEDFNIKVDGQALETLSGSGKAVANLAIRIGLGQVLTAKIFPVFMADEIDASMDMDRAGYTSECLRALTNVIPQVILVTHKQIDADQVVEISK